MSNPKEESKGPLRNFTFLESADKKLIELKQHTGKTMTAIIEDLLLGRRQFRTDIEQFISEQMERYGRPRNEIIEAALYSAMKLTSGQMPDAREFSERDIKAKAVAGSSAAIRLARESGKKQTAESPSESKSSRASSGRGNRH